MKNKLLKKRWELITRRKEVAAEIHKIVADDPHDPFARANRPKETEAKLYSLVDEHIRLTYELDENKSALQVTDR